MPSSPTSLPAARALLGQWQLRGQGNGSSLLPRSHGGASTGNMNAKATVPGARVLLLRRSPSSCPQKMEGVGYQPGHHVGTGTDARPSSRLRTTAACPFHTSTPALRVAAPKPLPSPARLQPGAPLSHLPGLRPEGSPTGVSASSPSLSPTRGPWESHCLTFSHLLQVPKAQGAIRKVEVHRKRTLDSGSGCSGQPRPRGHGCGASASSTPQHGTHHWG